MGTRRAPCYYNGPQRGEQNMTIPHKITIHNTYTIHAGTYIHTYVRIYLHNMHTPNKHPTHTPCPQCVFITYSTLQCNTSGNFSGQGEEYVNSALL